VGEGYALFCLLGLLLPGSTSLLSMSCFGDASIVPVRGRTDGDFGLEIPINNGNDRVIGLVYRQAFCLEFCGVK
jgi:hypothetical protein